MIFSHDTSPETRRILIEVLQGKTPAEKLAMVDQAFVAARDLTLSGLRLRHPDAGARELEKLYLEHLLGGPLAEEVLNTRGDQPRSAAPRPAG